MRLRLIGALLALPLAVALAGCAGDDGGDGIATAGGGTASPSATASEAADLSDDERALKFAQCMREHGVDMPDPEPSSGGGVSIRVGPGADKDKVDAAMEACKQYSPAAGQSGKVDPQTAEKLRRLARCMRENGVPNFPDPNADGGIRISSDMGFDPNDPTFKAAQEKCRQQVGLPKPGEVKAP
jgi:hypothetical protein